MRVICLPTTKSKRCAIGPLYSSAVWSRGFVSEDIRLARSLSNWLCHENIRPYKNAEALVDRHFTNSVDSSANW